jgi:hypothetical protein
MDSMILDYYPRLALEREREFYSMDTRTKQNAQPLPAHHEIMKIPRRGEYRLLNRRQSPNYTLPLFLPVLAETSCHHFY